MCLVKTQELVTPPPPSPTTTPHPTEQVSNLTFYAQSTNTEKGHSIVNITVSEVGWNSERRIIPERDVKGRGGGGGVEVACTRLTG